MIKHSSRLAALSSRMGASRLPHLTQKLMPGLSRCKTIRLFNSRFESSIFVDPEDHTIEIGGSKPSYKGSLVIVPTPIGNLGDLSLRQYEALTQCDIIACEDTRNTGKLI